jgi:xylulokinase
MDRSGSPLGHALIWTDMRSIAQQTSIREILGPHLGEITGNQIYDQPEPRMMWIRDNQPDRYAQTFKFLTPVSYLIFRFTGKMAASTSDWGFHLAFDRYTRGWNEEFCRAVGLDSGKFPSLYESSQIVGELGVDAARDTGLTAGTPVVAGGQDTPMITLAVGAVDAGQSAMMRGTTDLLCITNDSGAYHPDLYTTCSVLPGRFVGYDMKEVVAAGGSYRWLAATLSQQADSEEFERLNALAEQVPAGSNGLLFLPYLLISTDPDPNKHRAGSFFGLTTATTRAEMARSVLEGTAFALRETIGRLAESGIEIRELRFTGGPASSHLWNQISADVTGRPVLVPAASSGAAAYGAALLAGLGLGLIPQDDDYAALRDMITVRERFEPQSAHRAYQRFYDAFCRLANQTAGISSSIRPE